MRRRHRSLPLAATIWLVAACASPSVSTSPSRSEVVSSPTPSTSLAPSASPSTGSSSEPPAAPGGLTVGAEAVTVSDRLRVRSRPEVSDASKKYEPVLPLGTTMTIVGGPVEGSDYQWYEVDLPPGTLSDGMTRGWVAMGDHDGTPWIALADAPIAGLQIAMSTVPRSDVDPAAAGPAADSINAFAIDAYRELLKDEAVAGSNLVFSPASIALALGMVRAGARGTTAAEMDDVLHATGWETLGPGLNALSRALASRSDRWTDYDDAMREVALRIANTTFAQHDWALEPQFLDRIADTFGAGVHQVDYVRDPEAARQAINAWVDRETAHRIPELLAPPNVTANTRLYLVNAIYLKAEWDEWFDEGSTTDRAFTRADGSRIRVPTMETWRGFSTPAPYAAGDGWRATELRYRAQDPEDPALAMTLIRPDDLAAFESKVTTKTIQRIIRDLERQDQSFAEPDCPPEFDAGCYPYDLHLFMPKFGIDTKAELGELLAQLGMPTAFQSDRADLTGIHLPTSSSDNPFISAVIHQANIDVDEHGTEAAAATAVGVDTGGGPSPLDRKTLRLDRPFLFLLRDVETGAVLFLGRVVDPSAGS